MGKRFRGAGITPRQSSVAHLIASSPQAAAIFDRIQSLMKNLDPVVTRATKSQIAFRRRRGFAWVWVPSQYLEAPGTAPLVLSVALSRRDRSRRWKEVAEPRPGHFMHHLELRLPCDVDAEVGRWVEEAWAEAG